ncbi:MAG: hypothetical protein FWH04_08550 [Oscillospiraceae bacterium]|nr:hypothetical protein [Oscillospiraceae bacterium]
MTGPIVKLWTAGKGLSAVSGGIKAYQGLKGIGTMLFGTGAQVAGGAVANGGGLFGGVAQGLALKKAAVAGGPAAQSALAFAGTGKLGMGAKIGSAGLGGVAVAAGATAGAVTAGIGVIDATTDLIRALNSKDTRERETYGKSAAMKGGGIVAGCRTTPPSRTARAKSQDLPTTITSEPASILLLTLEKPEPAPSISTIWRTYKRKDELSGKVHTKPLLDGKKSHCGGGDGLRRNIFLLI